MIVTNENSPIQKAPSKNGALILSDSLTVNRLACDIRETLELRPPGQRTSQFTAKFTAKFTVEFIQTSPDRLDARLKRLITLLHAADIRITGRIVTDAQFVRELESLSAIEIKLTPEFSLREKLRALQQHILGLPHGIRFLEHMWQTQRPESKWPWHRYRGWRYATARRAFHHMGLQSAGVGILTMLGVSLLTHLGSPHSLWDAAPQLFASSLILSAWVYLFTAYQRETMSFKKQGTHVSWDEFRPPGQQLVVRHNKTVFSLISLSQEVVIGWLIMAAIAGPSFLAWEDYLNILLGAVAGAYSYIPPETALSKILDQAQAAQDQGDQAEHDRQLKRYVFWMRAWWWGAYTLLRNVPLLLPSSTHGAWGLWASIPLVAAGTLGWILDTAHDHPHLFKHWKKRWTGSHSSSAQRILFKLHP